MKAIARCSRCSDWTVNYSYFKTFSFYKCLGQNHYILSPIQVKLNSTYTHTVICFLFHSIYKPEIYVLRAKDVNIDLRRKWWGCLLFSSFSEEADQARVRSKSSVDKNIKEEASVEIFNTFILDIRFINFYWSVLWNYLVHLVLCFHSHSFHPLPNILNSCHSLVLYFFSPLSHSAHCL